MKRVVTWLCIIAILIGVLSLIGCKKDDQTDGGNTPSDSVTNQPTSGTDNGQGGSDTQGGNPVQGGNDPADRDKQW